MAELINISNNFASKDNIQAVYKLSNSDKLIIDKASEGCRVEDLEVIGKFFKSKGYEEDDWVVISPSPDINHKNHIFIDTFFYVIKEWYNGELGEFTGSVFGSNGSDLKPITTNKEYFPYTNEQILELYTAKKDYMFMSYNRRPSEHRVWFVNKLFETKLIEKGLVSFLSTKDMVVDSIKEFITLLSTTSDVSDKFLDNIPLIIDMNYDSSPKGTKQKQKFYDKNFFDSIHYYRNNYTIPFDNIKKCFFNVVTETDFYKRPLKLSEKIYKGITTSPIITFSSQYTLKRLREHGLKTFPMFFDESYDEIISDPERANKIFSEIEKVCNLPLSVLENKYREALDVVRHNQQILLNSPSFLEVLNVDLEEHDLSIKNIEQNIEHCKQEVLKYELDILFLNQNELIPLNTVGDEPPGDSCFKYNYKNENVVFKMEEEIYSWDESQISEVVKHIALRSKIDIDGIVKIFPVVVVLKCIKKGYIGFGIIMEKVEGNQPYDICLSEDYETRMEIKKQVVESLEELFNKYKLSWDDQCIDNILWNSKTRRATIIDPVLLHATNTYSTDIAKESKDYFFNRQYIPKEEWSSFVNLKNSRPVPNKSVYEFVVSEIKNANLYDLDKIPEFCENYSNWIQSTKLNNLIGLDNFNSKQYVHGTCQSFDFFYLSHIRKRMRCFKGDFAYHRLSWDKKFNWCYLEDDHIQTNDAVIMSIPFSDSGDIHPRTYEILDECEKWGVPVFIDCAYMIIARDIDFDFNRECIQGVSFSMSKGFYGAEKLRIGLRLTRDYKDDPVEVFNSMQMLNTVGVHVGQRIIDNYSVDYNNEKYMDRQIEICKDLSIEPSKCVLFGITDENHTEFGKHDRGTEWRRVCISPLFGDMKDLHYEV